MNMETATLKSKSKSALRSLADVASKVVADAYALKDSEAEGGIRLLSMIQIG